MDSFAARFMNVETCTARLHWRRSALSDLIVGGRKSLASHIYSLTVGVS